MRNVPPPDPSAAPESGDRAYLLKRAERHREQADRCEQAGSRSIHDRFRQLYEDRAAAIPADDA